MQRAVTNREFTSRQPHHETRYRRTRRRNGSAVLDILKGAIAGAAGVWVMDQVGWFMYNREGSAVRQQEREARIEGLDTAHVAANRLAEAAGVRLTPRQPHPAGIVVHYALGVAPAMLYAPLRKTTRGLAVGQGLVYGTALFLVNDELLAPALGLAAGPQAYPWQAHARGLVAHAVLGVVTHQTLELLDQVA